MCVTLSHYYSGSYFSEIVDVEMGGGMCERWGEEESLRKNVTM